MKNEIYGAYSKCFSYFKLVSYALIREQTF